MVSRTNSRREEPEKEDRNRSRFRAVRRDCLPIACTNSSGVASFAGGSLAISNLHRKSHHALFCAVFVKRRERLLVLDHFLFNPVRFTVSNHLLRTAVQLVIGHGRTSLQNRLSTIRTLDSPRQHLEASPIAKPLCAAPCRAARVRAGISCTQRLFGDRPGTMPMSPLESCQGLVLNGLNTEWP